MPPEATNVLQGLLLWLMAMGYYIFPPKKPQMCCYGLIGVMFFKLGSLGAIPFILTYAFWWCQWPTPSPKHTYSFPHQIMGGQEPSVSNKTYLALTWAVLLAAPTLIVSRTSRFSRWLLAAHRVFFPRSISRSTIHVDTCLIYWIVRLESLFQHVKPYFYRKFSLKDICEKRKRVIVSRTSKCAANMRGTNPWIYPGSSYKNSDNCNWMHLEPIKVSWLSILFR